MAGVLRRISWPVFALAAAVTSVVIGSAGMAHGTPAAGAAQQVSGEAGVLYGVAAASPTAAWAVGAASDNGTLILHWNGRSWARYPNSGLPVGTLHGVSALSSSDAWAVGLRTYKNRDYGPYVLHWNGKAWKAVAIPYFRFGTLESVTAVSASNVWAVGEYCASCTVFSLPWQTLIMHWNGRAWSAVKSPQPGKGGDFLFGVTASNAQDVWAVGSWAATASDETSHELIARLRGGTWRSVKTASAPADPALLGVAAASAASAWAVGFNGAPATRPLIEHWNGSAWSREDTRNPPLGSLAAVAVRSPGAAIAVGSGGTHETGTLVEHWNGVTWSVQPSPAPGGSQIQLNAAAYGGKNVGWAAGQYVPSGSTTPAMLLLEWTGADWVIR